ncbi:MAG: GDSL-type esterase/lipase family protein [Flavobacteriales bacterium]|nr:GDSL-type esterase/lipase family protein [Flavobacteriales bacterium]
MGISGDFSEGLIKRIDNVVNYNPKNVFIMIGINDIIEKVPLSEIKANYIKIIELIENRCPETNIYIQSTLPTTGLRSLLSSSKGINIKVQDLNKFLYKTTKEKNIVFIDMYLDYTNQNNELKKELTTDGIHLNSKGYSIWESYIKNYINTIANT